MILDCFSFFNELDVLTLRLRHLDTVSNPPDRFVIVEGTKTFAGDDKPLYYQEHRARFARWEDRIVHVIVDEETITCGGQSCAWPWPDVPANWRREISQRNAVSYALSCIGVDDDDLVLISDVDEIPHQIPWSLGPHLDVLDYSMAFYYYTLQHCRHEPWIGTKVVRASMVRRYTPEAVRSWRRLRSIPPEIEGRWGTVDGGWHFSHLYGADIARYQAKLRAGSHQEYNRPEYVDGRAIAARVAEGRDLFDRPVTMTITPIDGSYPSVITEDTAAWWPYLVQE